MKQIWKFLKIAVTYAAIKFFLDKYLFDKEFDLNEFIVKSLFIGLIIYLFTEWQYRYKEPNGNNSSN